MSTFRLTDTFNNRTISLHRTEAAAVRAQAKHQRAVRKGHGPSAYIPTRITTDGPPLPRYVD